MCDYIKNFVDNTFKKAGNINSTFISKDFENKLSIFSDEDLCELLIISGYIPDMYNNDSSEETLYTKLCEVLEVVWARRMGFDSNFVTQKSSYEDVVISINDKIIVSDTKTFRLGRSQAAPNVKDFVKPEDYRKWIERHQNNKLGGLVVFPQLHEWSKGSDAYLYCSDKENPIVMLPFHYLAYLLNIKNELNFDTNRLQLLWDYSNIFPKKVKDRIQYWKSINNRLLMITGDRPENLKKYLFECEEKIFNYVLMKVDILENDKKNLINSILNHIENLDFYRLKTEFKNYIVTQETKKYDDVIDRIKKFRLDKNHKESRYKIFIDEYFE